MHDDNPGDVQEKVTSWYSWINGGGALPIPEFPGYVALCDGTILSPRGIELSQWQRTPGSAWRVKIGGVIRMVSWLILTAWTGVPPIGYRVYYRDDDKANSHISNLEWGPDE